MLFKWGQTPRRVAALFRSVTDHLRVLTLQSETGDHQRIETTDEHPFWLVGFGWRDAQSLHPGDKLLAPDESLISVVSSVREEHPEGLTVFNFEVEGLHDYFVSATAHNALVLSHNMCAAGRATKQGGRITEPNLPPKTIAQQGDVEIVHYTRSGDHGPPHLHVKGGGPETKIGQAGKPIDGSPELTPAQAKVVEDNKSTIRKAVDQIGRWFRFNNADCDNDMEDNFVWVFNGVKGKFPGGIFTSLEHAEEWIRANSISGVLTKYPIDVGSFDWAKQKGFISNKLLASSDREFIGSFSSASFEHFHYEIGERA